MPYENLYIYYINGTVPGGRARFGSGFIGNWQEEDCSFLFFSEPADKQVDSLVAETPGLVLRDRFLMSYEEWIGADIRVFSAGGFRVVPPWRAADEKESQNVILLDPGVVFGAGTHTTTRDCMTALSNVLAGTSVSSTLDLGCGTGLLSIAAARMGSLRTLAVDKNFLAAETARNNILHNNLEASVLTVQGCAEDFIAMEAELVVANIHYDVMKKMISDPGFLAKKSFVLSGLLHTQAIRIEDDLRQMGAVIRHKLSSDGIWYTLAGSCGF